MNRTTIRIFITRIKFFLKSLFTRIGSEKTCSEAFIGKSDKPSIYLIIIFKVKSSATKVLASQSQKIENITRIRRRHSNTYKIENFKKTNQCFLNIFQKILLVLGLGNCRFKN